MGNMQDAAKILAELGDGGFSASEFELLTQLGRLSWVSWSSYIRHIHNKPVLAAAP